LPFSVSLGRIEVKAIRRHSLTVFTISAQPRLRLMMYRAMCGALKWQLLLVSICVLVTEGGKKKAPTLHPGDGRPRNWPAIREHIAVQWVQKKDCARDSGDGDILSFNHKGFIAELPPGKTTDGQGKPLREGMQFDGNMNPETNEAEPLEFVLGTPTLIVGMEAILRTMCVGETVRAVIPGPLAYDTRKGFFPYGTSVLYEMELVSLKKPGKAPLENLPGIPKSLPLASGLLLFLLAIGGSGYFLLRQSANQKKPNKVKKEGKKKR